MAEIRAAGGIAQAEICDVADPVAIARLAQAATPVDILVNNAGIGPGGRLVDRDDEVWERTLQVNLSGPMRLMRAVLPGMTTRCWGRVINIASTVAKTAYVQTAAYTASKHGLLGLTRVAALKVALPIAAINPVLSAGLMANCLLCPRSKLRPAFR